MAETKDCEVVQVMGRRWDSSRPAFFTALEGLSLEDIALQSIESAYRDKIYSKAQRRVLLKYARVRLNGAEKDRKYWKLIFPQKGDRIEILHGVRGGGGGGGKNPLATILSVLVVVVAAVATFWAGGAGAAIPLGLTATQFTTGVGLLAAGALMAINALFPAKPPSIGGIGGDGSAEKSSPTYSINGGKNAHNIDGYVPLILGRHRVTPPLGAKSWTNWAGDEQYFNMLVVWGHEHVTVSDFRIGDTALSKYSDVTHVFHQSTTGKGLRYFGWQYNEESVGAVIDTGWTTRTVGEGTGFSVDVEFQGGLCNINKTNGNKERRSVTLELQYKPTSGGSWKGFPITITRSFGPVAVDCGPSKQPVSVSQAGKVHAGTGYRNLYPEKSSGVNGGDVTWEYKSKYERRYEWVYSDGSGENGDYGGYHGEYVSEKVWYWEAKVSSGSFKYTQTGKIEISGAKQKRIVKSYSATGLPSKSYDVRIRRTSARSNDSYVIDECQWSTMRSIIQKPAFDTPVPICVSELRIKATEQLSGYVTEFSGLCRSKLPDWTPQKTEKKNGKTVTVPGNWSTWRETRNPASIMRYLLTSRHSLIKPFPVSRLDNDALVKLWTWCSKNGCTFDFVADSEENLWARLVQVLAPAMAGPTTDVDGLWGAIIDQPDKTVRQMFTPRNSWGMSIQRGFARLPDAMRVKFIDETDDYKQKEGFVYNDGYNKDGSGGKKKANDVIEWSFEGVTNWSRMYKLARYHMAQMLHRQMTVTINTDWEWLAVHRGDLVGLSSDVLMNTFGTARVMRKVYKASGKVDDAGAGAYIMEDSTALIDTDSAIVLVAPGESIPEGGKLIGVEIDDTVYYTSPSPARYGIALRGATGKVSIIEVRPQYGEESSILYFADSAQAAVTPPDFGDLVSVSLLGSEYEEYLVSSITPGENMSAQITLVPYKAKEIYEAATKPIPAYSAPVVLDQIKGASDLPTPIIKDVVSDERVARVSASGAVEVCIGAAWSLPPTTENLSYFTVQIVATMEDSGAEITASSINSEEYAIVGGAETGKRYFVKIRIHDPATGRASAWSTVVIHTVAGLVMPPPAPQNVRAVPNYPNGILIYWDEVQVIDLRRYVISGDAEGQTNGKETQFTYTPYEQSGELSYEVWSLDTTDHKSNTAGTATLTVDAPGAPIWRPQDVEDEFSTGARLENEGVVLTYAGVVGTWPIEIYEGECLDKTTQTASIRCVVPYSPEFMEGDTARVRAKDVYGNWGAWSESVRVQVIPPLKPELEIGAREDGTAVFQWTDCRVYTDIKHYILSGASIGSTTNLYLVLNVSTILWETFELTQTGGQWYASMGGESVPATIDEDTKTVSVGGETYNLGAEVEGTFTFNAFRIGAITERIQAEDKYGFKGPVEEKTFKIKAPYNPVVSFEPSAEGVLLAWQNCKTTFNIQKYIVHDYHYDAETGGYVLDYVYEVNGMTQRLVPRRAGLYKFSVQAVDCIGNYSSVIEREVEFDGVGAIAPEARVDGSDILLSWTPPSTTWPIEWYVVYDTRQREIARCKTTFYRLPSPAEGSYAYNVVGIDVAGNAGPLGTEAEITIWPPMPPVINRPARTGQNVTISWRAGDAGGRNVLPVAAWDVVHYWEYDDDQDGVPSEAEHDYGRLDVDSIEISASSTGGIVGKTATAPELSFGTHWFQIRAIDTAGNVGEFSEEQIEISAPGKVSFQNCSVVDNNVMLYWSEPDRVYLPIEYYLFEQVERYQSNGETVEYRAQIGRIDARFAASFETESGTYIYAITPVDVAGNMGEPSEIVMQVSQPPDFILYHTWDSLYSGGNCEEGRSQPNGGKTNFIIDGESHMYGPFSDATWQENLNALAALKSVAASGIEWEDKVGWGFEYFSDPTVLSAQYVEIVDVGTIIPSTTIQVTIDSVTLYGEPVFSCRIETSQDAETWVEIADDAMMVYAGEFRYVRYTIGLTGGVVQINNIRYKLDVKRKTDFGQVIAYGEDTELSDGTIAKANGDGYNAQNPSLTPMEWGVWVPFNIEFSDVTSLPKPNVVNHPELIAYTVFERTLNPEGFRVFVMNDQGERVTATVDWSAFGV